MTTLHEINQKAQALLRSALGPVDYARYVQQFSNGSGDYTAERQLRPEEDVQAIHERAVALRAAGIIKDPPNARKLEMK